MPSYFPEGNAPHPQDSVRRSLQKINGALYDAIAAYSTVPDYFPLYGNQPESQDTERRSLQKINGLLQGLPDAIASGGSGIYLADDVADAKAQTTRWAVIRIPSLGWDFNWVATSVVAGDDVLVLTPDDITEPAAGRYERFI